AYGKKGVSFILNEPRNTKQIFSRPLGNNDLFLALSRTESLSDIYHAASAQELLHPCQTANCIKHIKHQRYMP
ncbi:32050_t:CDS:1, partial [Gigaspora margarita]